MIAGYVQFEGGVCRFGFGVDLIPGSAEGQVNLSIEPIGEWGTRDTPPPLGSLIGQLQKRWFLHSYDSKWDKTGIYAGNNHVLTVVEG